MTREEFLTHIRASLDRGAEHASSHSHAGQDGTPASARSSPGASASATPPELDEALLRLAARDADLLSLFVQRAEGVGMKVRRTSRATLREDLASELRARVDSNGAVAVSVADDELRRASEGAIAACERTTCDWSASPGIDALYDAAFGITDVEAAIAETGSLVVASGAWGSRGGFLVPPVHIALVRAERIVADLIDFMPRGGSGTMPTSRVFITGPSKTADIEGILVTGIHGPREVLIMLIDSAG